ncbi:MAG: SPOR domain-containing protein [Coxiellaceae bacterium]|nr:SPOR domain-containing protein [Coxiellaceae bacterium]
MEERTKQRLVGVLVFVGALFIVLPFLFHNSHPSVSASQKAADDTAAAVTVSMPSENNALPAALKTQNIAINDSNPGSPDQNAVPSTSQVAATPGVAVAPASAPQAPQAVTTDTAAIPLAQPANPTAASSTNTANVPAGDAAMPANNPTKFPSIVPGNTAAPLPSAPANNADTGADTSAATQQNASLNKTASSVTVAVAASVPNAKVEIKKPVAHPVALRSSGGIDGWTIQLGAFSDKANANHLMAMLREHRFHVYSRELSQGAHHALTLVFVGPERSLDHARFAQQHLRTEFKLNGEIKRYE